MRELLGIDVPVHAGAERPLLAEPRPATMVHGESGLDGADLPDADAGRSTAATPSSSSSRRAARQEGVWIVAVGPLTNIALALRLAPDLAGRIAGISLMGGGTFGNRSAVAEFNIWADPRRPRPCSATAARW